MEQMTYEELRILAEKIESPDPDAVEAAKKRQESLAKPPGSLGMLEDISVRMAGITGRVINEIKQGCVVIMCADNGVVSENVASCPQTVTMAQTVNFTRRATGVGALAESFGSELLIVDVGVKHPIPEGLYDDTPLANTHKIVNRRLRAGTDDLAKGPAMSRQEALRCIAVGLEMADAVKAAGFDIIGTGEMGIGNTTTSAAVLSAVTGKDSHMTCGRGAGLTDEGYGAKCRIVDEASAKYRARGGLLEMMKRKEAEPEMSGRCCPQKPSDAEEDCKPGRTGKADASRDPGDPASIMIDILSEMGGFDICAMAGVFIGAAANRMPVVIDGYISVVAAVAAYIIAPASREYMFASHRSHEKGYAHAVDILGLRPFMSLDMRLGEGSGCPIAFDIIRGACDVMKNMATFEEAEIDDGYLEEIRRGDCF